MDLFREELNVLFKDNIRTTGVQFSEGYGGVLYIANYPSISLSKLKPILHKYSKTLFLKNGVTYLGAASLDGTSIKSDTFVCDTRIKRRSGAIIETKYVCPTTSSIYLDELLKNPMNLEVYINNGGINIRSMDLNYDINLSRPKHGRRRGQFKPRWKQHHLLKKQFGAWDT